MLVIHGHLLTFDAESRIVPDGAFRVEGARITAVGSTRELCARYPAEKCLDAQGMLVMPGLVCAHSQLYRSLAHGLIPPDRGGAARWQAYEAALDYEAIRYAILLGCIAAIRSGTTTVFEQLSAPNIIEHSLDATAEAVTQVGLRASLCYRASERGGKGRAIQGIQENVRLGRRVAGLPLLIASMGLDRSFALSDETLRMAVAAAALARLGFHVGLARDVSAVYESLHRYGYRPVERFRRYGVLGRRTILTHGVSVLPEEMYVIATSGAWLVPTPRATVRDGSRLAPLVAYLDRGVIVGLGTGDSSPDMLAEMRSAHLLYRQDSGRQRAPKLERVAELVFTGNASMASHLFRDHLGRIASGALADIIMVPYPLAELVTEENWERHLLLGLGPSRVDTTIVAGRILMRHRELLTIDESIVTARAAMAARRLQGRVA